MCNMIRNIEDQNPNAVGSLTSKRARLQVRGIAKLARCILDQTLGTGRDSAPSFIQHHGNGRNGKTSGIGDVSDGHRASAILVGRIPLQIFLFLTVSAASSFNLQSSSQPLRFCSATESNIAFTNSNRRMGLAVSVAAFQSFMRNISVFLPSLVIFHIKGV